MFFERKHRQVNNNNNNNNLTVTVGDNSGNSLEVIRHNSKHCGAIVFFRILYEIAACVSFNYVRNHILVGLHDLGDLENVHLL